MRWQSRIPPRSWTSPEIDSAISEPIVIGGTNFPSIDVEVDHLRAGVHHELDLLGEVREVATRAETARSGLSGSPRHSRPSKAARASGPKANVEELLDGGPRRHGRRVERVPLPSRQSPAHADLGERPGLELVLDRDPRLERDAEPEPDRLLDRAVRAERQRLRAQVVVGEELGHEQPRPRAALAHQPDTACELVGPDRPAARELVPGRGDQRDLVLEERPPGDPLVLRRPPGDRDVDLVLEHAVEELGAVRDLERQVDLGVRGGERRAGATAPRTRPRSRRRRAAATASTGRRPRVRPSCPARSDRARRRRTGGRRCRRRSARPRGPTRSVRSTPSSRERAETAAEIDGCVT